eukprot:TRINITY_DN9799_c0_g2_i2.p2 TRINITY_DN9799_c0_g2~~TRINITY_DN9799_c0_g2_i2.p2  ORF type:complete len:284 (-),score=85.32 TRINITY_DN9799_c0_g2_i2:318-1169(-)
MSAAMCAQESGGSDHPTVDTIFGAFMGISFLFSLTSVLVALVLFMQMNTLLRTEDIKWYIRESERYHLWPSYLLLCAIVAMVIGHILMVLLLHGTRSTEYSAITVGVLSVLVILLASFFAADLKFKVDRKLCESISNIDELRRVFALVDRDNEGRVSTSRMMEHLMDRETQRYIQVTAAKVGDMVEAVDANGDGWVTWEEFRDYLSVKHIEDQFSLMDMDKDGGMTLDEFQHFFVEPGQMRCAQRAAGKGKGDARHGLVAEGFHESFKELAPLELPAEPSCRS